MDNIQIEKEIKTLQDSKLDNILLENVNTDELSKIDLSGETDAVVEAITVIKLLISKLKSK